MWRALRSVSRVLLGLVLILAGASHLLVPEPFLAQVPPWLPWPTPIIVVSGLIEIGLGLALVVVKERRQWVGWLTIAFFVVIFPGNLSQWLTQTDGFGLDTDTERLVRLFFQPVLMAWAWWRTRPHKADEHES